MTATALCPHRVPTGSYCTRCAEARAAKPAKAKPTPNPAPSAVPDPEVLAPLTDVELVRCAELEDTIERGAKAFGEVAAALLEIRDLKLYRHSHATFEAYCRERWGFAKSQAYRLLEAGEVIGVLSPIGDIPANEAQARELAPLLDEPEVLADAWEEAQSDGVPTAAKVKAAVEARRPKKQKAKRKPPVTQLCFPVSELRLVVDGDEGAVGRVRERLDRIGA